MTNKLIRDCWEAIQQIPSDRLQGEFEPLLHMEPYLQCFGLAPLPAMAISKRSTPELDLAEPSFKGLGDSQLYALRSHAYGRTKLELVEQWSEKLMRFCEVRYSSLRQRSLRKCQTRAAAQVHILHLSTFLMDQAFQLQDVRYCNTVLKLADLPWVLSRSRLLAELQTETKDASSALFQFRVLLATENFLMQLCAK